MIEIAILGATLLTTVGLSLFIALQARRHFRLEHAKEFIARFNAAEMVRVRDVVDRWFAQRRLPGELIDAERTGAPGDAAEAAIAMRTFINFFQELGVAWKHGTVHREYTWDLFGGLIRRYWRELSPYCEAQRAARMRPTLYRDFENLVQEMDAMDAGRTTGDPATTSATGGDEGVYLFGYGSLICPDSVARTLGRNADAGRLKTVWLNGYERGWTVRDMARFNDEPDPRPTAFLNIAPHAGRRCNGIAVPITTADLEGFDRRERSYQRIDVSEMITPPLDRPVHAYVGCEPWTDMPDNTVVAAKYGALVESAIARWGDAFTRDYHATTQPCVWPAITGDYSFVTRPK